jgi:hypothetical protein
VTDDPSLTPGGEKGLKWKQALKDAFDIEFDGKKKAGGGDQFFEVEHIYVWGNNPVREYRVILKALPGQPPGT